MFRMKQAVLNFTSNIRSLKQYIYSTERIEYAIFMYDLINNDAPSYI